jgi:hypothetical protein
MSPRNKTVTLTLKMEAVYWFHCMVAHAHWDNQMKDDVMGVEHSTYGTDEKYKVLVEARSQEATSAAG